MRQQTEPLVRAARLAWDDLDREGQPGLVAREKVADRYLAGKVLERWLKRRIANAA